MNEALHDSARCCFANVRHPPIADIPWLGTLAATEEQPQKLVKHKGMKPRLVAVFMPLGLDAERRRRFLKNFVSGAVTTFLSIMPLTANIWPFGYAFVVPPSRGSFDVRRRWIKCSGCRDRLIALEILADAK